MTITEIAKQVKETESAMQMRYRANPAGEKLILRDESGNIQYDAKPLFNGKSRGWQVFDLFTASAVCAVYDALSDENKKAFDRIPVQKLLDFVWSHVN